MWCEYAELELRANRPKAAIALMKRATGRQQPPALVTHRCLIDPRSLSAPPPQKTAYFDDGEMVQKRVHKSLRVWSMYADLEESFGTLEVCHPVDPLLARQRTPPWQSTKAVYNRIIDLRIATPQIIMNYAVFLEEHRYFEEAFQVRSLLPHHPLSPTSPTVPRPTRRGSLSSAGPTYSTFGTPTSSSSPSATFPILPNELGVGKTKGVGLLRAVRSWSGRGTCSSSAWRPVRPSSPRASSSCTPSWRRSTGSPGTPCPSTTGPPVPSSSLPPQSRVARWDGGAGKVSEEDMYDVFNIYIKKAAELYGITHTRPIYEKAIEELPSDRARDMCLRFAELEKKLGEIDRARAVYAHASQMCDPRVHPSFWDIWKDFEVLSHPLLLSSSHPLPPFLRSGTGTRTRCGRCCGSSAVSRPPSIPRSQSTSPITGRGSLGMHPFPGQLHVRPDAGDGGWCGVGR